jgi:hypothetical protein
MMGTGGEAGSTVDVEPSSNGTEVVMIGAGVSTDGRASVVITGCGVSADGRASVVITTGGAMLDCVAADVSILGAKVDVANWVLVGEMVPISAKHASTKCRWKQASRTLSKYKLAAHVIKLA